MATPIGRYPRLADLSDVPRLLSGDGVHYQWPPPGTDEVYVATPGPWVIIYGEPSTGAVGDWFVTSVNDVVQPNTPGWAEELEKLALRFTGPYGNAFGNLLEWPVIYEVGQGAYMRWLKVILAGSLAGGVEQFQHSFSLGKPGADPDLTPEDQLLLAEQIAGWWSTKANSTDINPGYSLVGVLGGSVRYTEVGVVQLEKNGGSVTQADGTQWFGYPINTGPVGTSVCLPLETACCITLQTDVRGPRGRGRTYLPPFNTNQLAADGAWSANTVVTVANVWASFMQQIIDGTPHEPIVVSRAHQVLNRVEDINVGRVPDSQRRRRRSQAEARVSASPVLDY